MKKSRLIALCFVLMLALVLSGCGKQAEVVTEAPAATEAAPAEEPIPEPLAYSAVPALDPESAPGFASVDELREYFAQLDDPDDGTKAPQETSSVVVSSQGQGSRVVTIGELQYVLDGRDMFVLRLNAGETEVLSRTTVAMDWTTETTSDGLSWKGGEKVPAKLYVSDTWVTVVSDRFGYTGKTGETGMDDVTYREYTAVDIYDASDPKAPALKFSVGQSGYFQEAELKDGMLTVVTCFDVLDEAVLPSGYNFDEATELPLNKIVGVTHPYAKAIEVVGVYVPEKESKDLFGVAGTDSCACLADGTVLFTGCRTAEAPSRTYTKDGVSYSETAFVGVTDVLALSSKDGSLTCTGVSTLPAMTLAGARFAKTEKGWAVLAATDAHRETTAGSASPKVEDEVKGWNVLLLDEELSFVSAVPVYEEKAPVWCALGNKCLIYGNEDGKITYSSFDGAVSLSRDCEPLTEGYIVETEDDTFLLARKDGESFLYRYNAKGEVADIIKLGGDYSSLYESRDGWFYDSGKDRLGLAADDSYSLYRISEDKLIYETSLFTSDWGWNNGLISKGGSYYLTSGKEVYVLSPEDLTELLHLVF